MWETLKTMVWNIFHRPGFGDILDIFIVAVILYGLLMLVRKTRSSAVLKGLMLFLLASGLSDLLGLTTLNWILMSIVNNGAVVMIILFQPELRKILEQLGRGAIFDTPHKQDAEGQRIITEVVQCLTRLSRRRVGALIVFERRTGLQDVVETGIEVDARITAALLENIFEPNTPLHDGAVVIRGNRVQAGACILTLTEGTDISHDLGTRHRAALGVSETTDAIVLVVSEETGIISMAKGGKLTRNLEETSLRRILSLMYAPLERKSVFQTIFPRKQKKVERT